LETNRKGKDADPLEFEKQFGFGEGGTLTRIE